MMSWEIALDKNAVNLCNWLIWNLLVRKSNFHVDAEYWGDKVLKAPAVTKPVWSSIEHTAGSNRPDGYAPGGNWVPDWNSLLVKIIESESGKV